MRRLPPGPNSRKPKGTYGFHGTHHARLGVPCIPEGEAPRGPSTGIGVHTLRMRPLRSPLNCSELYCCNVPSRDHRLWRSGDFRPTGSRRGTAGTSYPGLAWQPSGNPPPVSTHSMSGLRIRTSIHGESPVRVTPSHRSPSPQAAEPGVGIRLHVVERTLPRFFLSLADQSIVC